MRFSLMTLLLISLWIGAALGVWFRREAWVLDRFEKRPMPEYGELLPNLREDANRMPDGRREVGPLGALAEVSNPGDGSSNPFGDVVYDHKLREVIYTFPNVRMYSYSFTPRSDDAFEVCVWLFKGSSVSPDSYGLAHYRRRFPEWWWGHLYRPEVWAFAVLFIALIVRGVQALRRRRQARAV